MYKAKLPPLTGLRERRKALNISQMDLAALLGVSLVSYRIWEAGAGSPSKENRQRLEETLERLEEEAASDTLT